MNFSEITRLVTFIEENLRASPTAGLKFVDSRQYQTRLLSRQNHVVFGRRGAGKTTLAHSVRNSSDHIDIYLNMEDYKDITFPNIIIHTLIQLFDELETIIEQRYRTRIFRKKINRILKSIKSKKTTLSKFLYEPDSETKQISEKEGRQDVLGGEGGYSSVKLQGSKTHEYAKEVKREIKLEKMGHLRIELPEFKKLLIQISEIIDNKSIYLILDDYYFIKKQIQPDLIDYIHRLTKGTSLFIKIATIKHRSKLYTRANDQYIGVELGHDIFDIDMDYTLDRFNELQEFMRQLLQNAIDQSGANINIDDIFAGDGFSQLCLASGGVPRDFLSLFVTLANQAAREDKGIGKVEVNAAAISNYSSKFSSLSKDSGSDDLILQHFLSKIKSYVYSEKRTNAFLVAKEDLDAKPHGLQAIRELVDLRLIHLVEENTSKAPSDGRRYEAYILDLSLYDNPRPRNFKQIEPGFQDDKSRKDDLRASPIFELKWFEEEIPITPTNIKPVLEKETQEKPEQLKLDLSFE